jgi:putative ABC transport system substrate-binding protein
LQLLKDAIPRLERVALLLNPSELSDADEQIREMQAGASRLGLVLQVFDVRRAADIEPALDSAVRRRCQAVQAAATDTLAIHRVRVAELAAARRLPTCSDFPLMARAGFVLAYGPDLDDLGRRAAGYVKRILDGARPADLPIERPTRFSLVVNLKAARAIGFVVPRDLLLRADEVIE